MNLCTGCRVQPSTTFVGIYPICDYCSNDIIGAQSGPWEIVGQAPPLSWWETNKTSVLYVLLGIGLIAYFYKAKGSSSSDVRSPTSTEVRSPTSTSTEVRSPTSTSTEVRSPTSTSTEAYTADNFTSTVTGGAGAGATSVYITPPSRSLNNKGFHKFNTTKSPKENFHYYDDNKILPKDNFHYYDE
jgi:hypothetical protein